MLVRALRSVSAARRGPLGLRNFARKTESVHKLKREAAALKNRVAEMEEELQFFQQLMIESQETEDDYRPVGHPIFKKKQPKVTDDMISTGDAKELCRTLIEKAVEGDADGLAAPQIGIPLRIIAVNTKVKDMSASGNGLMQEDEDEAPKDPNDYECIVNPTWTAITDEMVSGMEVCLSVPGLCAKVKRHNQIKVSGLSANGEPLSMMLRGWPARVVQHECDHLDGLNFTDRMEPRSLSVYEYGFGELEKMNSNDDEASPSETRIDVQ